MVLVVEHRYYKIWYQHAPGNMYFYVTQLMGNNSLSLVHVENAEAQIVATAFE